MKNLHLDIALSYLGGRKKQTAISVAGVMLGVGFFIGMAALIQGFQSFFLQTVVDVSPHIIMYDDYREPPQQPAAIAWPDAAIALSNVKPKTEIRGIKGARAIIDDLSGLSGVTVSPTLEGQILLRYGNTDVSGTLTGIVPDRERYITKLDSDMIEGSLEELSTHANGIVLGRGLARKLGVHNGDTVTALSPAGIIKKMKIVGLFDTGITQLDDATAYTLLKKNQILQDKINVINSIRMHLEDSEIAPEMAQQIESRFSYRSVPWQEANKGIFDVFVVQNIVLYSTTSAILIVACFGIYNIISTLTNEKMRDIAILKSIGFEEGEINSIFITQGLCVGVTGTVMGWVFGYLLCQGLENIQVNIDALIHTTKLFLHYSIFHYAIGGGFAILSSVLAAYIPAHKAAALKPVDIIRGAA